MTPVLTLPNGAPTFSHADPKDGTWKNASRAAQAAWSKEPWNNGGTLISPDEVVASAMRRGWTEQAAREQATRWPVYEVDSAGNGIVGGIWGPDIQPERPHLQVARSQRGEERDRTIAHELRHGAQFFTGQYPYDGAREKGDVETLSRTPSHPVARRAAELAMVPNDEVHWQQWLLDRLNGDLRRLPLEHAERHFWMLRDREQAGTRPHRTLIPSVRKAA